MTSSFISLYQEKIAQEKDYQYSTQIICGTQTSTDVQRESSDQDPRNFGTQTQTRVRETPDSNFYNQKFVIIP